MAITINRKPKEVSFRLYNEDCLTQLRLLEDNSVDAVITDPPAGISFMGKDWDHNKDGRDTWVRWMTRIMKECYRVLKPGGHMLVWSIPRTSHWTAWAIESSGFSIRDMVAHINGQGFPKNQNISKMIDKHFGVDREVVGVKPGHEEFVGRTTTGHLDFKNGTDGFDRPWMHDDEKREAYHMETAPATPQAKKWDGFGTALKPSLEPWWLAQKPCSEDTIVKNVLKWGTGAINIDKSRIALQAEGEDPRLGGAGSWKTEGMAKNVYAGGYAGIENGSSTLGRYPSNTILTHTEECIERGTIKVKVAGGGSSVRNEKGVEEFWGEGGGGFTQGRSTVSHGDENGEEEVMTWDCHPDCPILQFPNTKSGKDRNPTKDKVSGFFGNEMGYYSSEANYGDAGSSARFFYTTKSSPKDRSMYLSEGTINNHPTVKSLKLMSYMINMITPPNGIVLDPFTGSGSTGLAALENGFSFIGCEKDKDFHAIALMRLTNCKAILYENKVSGN
jgi:site-specific DNA-methyltransferase (adenine-specific)